MKICVSSVINDVEHFFMCLLAIHISSLEKWLLKPFAQFLNWTVWFFVVLLFPVVVGVKLGCLVHVFLVS